MSERGLTLRIACARAERAHDNSRSALLPTQQLGDRINLLGREGDDRAALGELGGLDRTGIAKLGKPLADIGFRLQPKLPEHWRHGPGTKKQGLFSATRVQDPIGEDMPAISIFSELDLIDSEKINRLAHRHGLNRANEIPRGWRHDALFAVMSAAAPSPPPQRHGP
jgi:hypothetical protein